MAAKSTLTPDVIMVKRLIDTFDEGDIRAYAYDSGQLSPLNNNRFGGQVKSPTLPSPQLSITPVNIIVEAVGDLDGGKVEINLGSTQLFFAFGDLTRPKCPDALNPETDSLQLTANQYNAIITPNVDIRWRLSYFGQARPCNDPDTYIRIRLDHQYRGPGFTGGDVKQTIWQSYHQTLVGGVGDTVYANGPHQGEPVVVTGQHQRDPHTGGFNVTHESMEPLRQRLSMSGRRIFQEILPDGRVRSFTGLRSRGELHGQMVSFSSSGSCQPI